MSTKKCPLCNRKLVAVNGVPTCPDCGYRDPQSGSAAYTQQNTPPGTGSGASTTYTRQEEPKKGKKSNTPVKAIVGVCGSVVLAVVVGVVISFVKRGLYDAMDSAADNIADRWAGESEAEPKPVTEAEPETTPGSENPEGGKPQMSDKGVAYRIPQSEFLVALVEELFQKPVNQVSYEEINSIVYLETWNPEGTDAMQVSVMLADGTEEGYLISDYFVDTTDFKCLTGLQYLILDEGSISYGTDWHNLTQLQVLSCDTSMDDLTDYMDVSQLVWLSTRETFGMSGLSVLSKYTNLEHLELEAGLLGSIAGISQAPALRELYITEGDRITDFSELYQMTGLEVLSIESHGLKDIGFVSGMNQLQCLELKDTDIRSIEVLADCADTLTVLRLDDNYQIDDISPVMLCTGLEELQLWVDYRFDVPMEIPDFSGMTNLRRLSVENYDKWGNLALLTGLEELTLEGSGTGDGEPLKALKNLKRLNLIDMSLFEGFMDSVASLESLESLNLEDSFVWSDMSPVFGLPALQELTMKDAECGLMPEKLTACNSLVFLDLSDTTFDRLLADGSWNYGDEEEIPVQEVLEAMAPCMPNLNWLYAPKQELDNLEFAKNLTQLTWLDIQDNYIVSLEPLIGLGQLRVLLCEDNPIQNTDGLEHVIIFR